MKFSASFIVLAFIFSKTALSLPLDSDGYDLLERDLSDAHDLEARELYDNVYEERSFDDDELFERDLFHEDLEARARSKAASKPASKPAAKPAAKPKTPAKPAPKTPAKPGDKSPAKPGAKSPAKPGAKSPAKPGAKSPAKKPGTQAKKPAGKCKRPPTRGGKNPTPGGEKPTPGGKKPTPGGKKPTTGGKKPAHGGKKRSFEVRTDTGQVITVSGQQFLLGESTSGSGGAKTFKVQGGRAFAKRPRHPGNPPPDFTQEIISTKRASDALHTGLYITHGPAGGYMWLITAAMPGGEISSRWFMNPHRFATRKACEDDFNTAKALVKASQRTLASRAGLVHGDNHPGNWFVPLTGHIDRVLPIDFGITRPPNTDIEHLVNQQYKYPPDYWASFAECGVCAS